MKRNYQFWIYIMASKSGTLYVGFTRSLEERIREHKEGLIKGFTQKYHCNKLLYFEEFKYANNALDREKQIKNWNRGKKVFLIESINPKWADLAVDWHKGSLR